MKDLVKVFQATPENRGSQLPAKISPVFGVVDPKLIRTNLPGRIRVRLRNEDFGVAFVRYNGETRQFIIFDAGDHWLIPLEFEQGGNFDAERQDPPFVRFLLRLADFLRPYGTP